MSTRIIQRKTRPEISSMVTDPILIRTAGSFLKATDDLQKPKKYYKLSNYDGING